MTKRRQSARSTKLKRQPAMSAAKGAKVAKTAQALAPAIPSVRPSKKASILALLGRPQGAAISDLTDATGWQTHSVRAALTGLRKEGKELARIKNEGGVTHYRLAAGAVI
jgi:hypothetical protein